MVVDQDLEDGGVEEIALGLSYNATICNMKLNLEGNKVGDIGAIAISKPLRTNQRIQILHLNLSCLYTPDSSQLPDSV